MKFTLNTLYSQHERSISARLCFLDFIIRFPTLCYPVKRKQANFLTPLMSGEHCRFLGILALISSVLKRRFLGRVSFQFFLQWWHSFKPPLLKNIVWHVCLGRIYYLKKMTVVFVFPYLLKRFDVLKKCKNKLDCLVHEMLFIREPKSTLNVQSDSIRVKVFL